MPDEKKEVKYITRDVSYVDNNNRVIDEHVIVMGAPPKDYVRFTARGTMTAQFPMGTATKNLCIPLPGADTPEEAFALIEQELPKALVKAKVELQEEIRQQMADAQQQEGGLHMPPPNILDSQGRMRGPDGPLNPGGIHRR